jgi:hypothetical protein
MKKKESKCQTKKIKIWPKHTGRMTVGRNVSWIWTCVTVLQITNPSSPQRGRPTWSRKNGFVTQRNVKSGHLLQRGPSTQTDWPTDRRSQYNFVAAVTFLSDHYLAKIRGILSGRCQVTEGEYTYRNTEWLEGFLKYIPGLELGSDTMLYIRRFIMIGPDVKKLVGGYTDTQIHRHRDKMEAA